LTIRWDTIDVNGSEMKAYVAIPMSPGPHPAVVIAHHLGALGHAAPGKDTVFTKYSPSLYGQMQDVVHKLYREGYAVALPALFHRQPEDITNGSQRVGLLRDEELVVDIKAAIAHLRKLSPTVTNVGVVGFCMGGHVAYLSACAIPELKAAAMFYGGQIMKPWGNGPSPFERSASMHCPLIGFFGVEDVNPSPDDMRKMDEELTRLGKWHEFHQYRDTGHAFQNFHDTERYRERAARASWEEMLAFFTQFLKRGAVPS
jgi:carboxymethylenebutenolidase